MTPLISSLPKARDIARLDQALSARIDQSTMQTQIVLVSELGQNSPWNRTDSSL